MITMNYHNSYRGRVAITLLLILGIIGLWGLPAMAQSDCPEECNSQLVNEVHTYDPGMKASMCPEPVPNFCACPREGCDSLLVNFTDLSVGYIDTWEWDFGDPNSGSDNYSDEENPSHWYMASGLYSITLTVTGPGGTASITKDHYVEVLTAPTADFAVVSQSGCIPVTVKFEDRSTGGPVAWWWDFGDGTSSTEQNPSHTYAQNGTYLVTLKAYNSCGRDMIQREIVVEGDEAPTADFTSDVIESCVGATVYFTDLSLYAETWLWSFGDGGSSVEQNPTHVYNAPGAYTVQLKVTNECGRDIVVKKEYITIYPEPTADFTSSARQGCDELEVSFTDISYYASSWHWDFGDGDTSDEQNPTHTYTSPGKYTVKLTVGNICGTDEMTKVEYVTVYTSPTADFTYEIFEACVGGTVEFTDQSSYAVSWWWDFGDGTSSTEQNPTHVYSTGGIYTVTLKVYNMCGRDIISKEIEIIDGVDPIADFTSYVREGCEETTVNFTDLSNDADTWSWDFGDGGSSNEQNPSHTYTAAGKYTVRLVVTNICGEDDTTKTEYITIYPGPTADFTSDIQEGCVNTVISFTDLSIAAETWHWDFGDGADSDEQNPLHSYNAAGKYTVRLTVTNECGDDEEIKTEYITILDGPTADFTADPTQTCTGATVAFTDLSVNADDWMWDFGDGGTSDKRNPDHVYNRAGVYTVTLTVTNICGKDVKVREAYITVDVGPIADFTSDVTETCVDATVNFTDLSTDALNWSWDFGDRTYSKERNPSHVYTSAGVYTVSLWVSNECGEDIITKNEYITVLDGPTADFGYEVEKLCDGMRVFFTDRSTDADSWSWDFGDGNTSVEQNPTHLYTSEGSYVVMLTVSNECGYDSTTDEIIVTFIPPPTADFSSDLNEICEGGEVTFTNLSTNADSYEWDFGDGTTSDDVNPTHSYSTAGVYNVSLKATNICGADREIKTEYITVLDGPTADFEGTPLSGQAPLTVAFSDLSTSDLGIDSWTWDFGDGDGSNEQNPSHVYTAPGYYTVELLVTDGCGRDSTTKTEYVYVIDTCSIDFSFEPGDGCAELLVGFSGASSGPCEISSWTWDFGDPASGNDNVATGQLAQHLYKNPGTYTVSLTVEDISGTKVVTKTDIITVYGPPEADFDASPTTGIAPLTVSFTDQSVGGLPVDSWEWDFGDPSSGNQNVSTLQNPRHVYNAEGVYTVSLIVTNECGVDTAFGEIDVSPAISIVKAVDKPIAAAGDELLYTLTITNNSDGTIGEIVVLDTIPDSTAYVAGSVTGAGLHNSFNDMMTWNIMGVAPGEMVEVSFKVLLDGPFTQYPATVSNVAIAMIYEEPAKAASSRTFVSNIVQTLVDMPTGLMEIDKDVSATLASPGDMLTYVITVINRNPIAANNVMVYDAIPDSTTYVAGSITGGGVYDPATDSLVWDIGTLGALESRSDSFRVTVDAGVADGHKIPNTALVRSSLGDNESNQVITSISLEPIVVTKTTSTPSGMTGDLVRFTITVENFSDQLFTDVQLLDTMPDGIFYVDGTSLVDGAALADPVGDNPLLWLLGDLPASGTFTVEYTGLIGASAHPGLNDNIARAQAYQGGRLVSSNRAVARIYILSYTLTGSIRGKVVVDCDGDGVPDMEMGPTGMDVYLDDGSQSKVNENGMFYFSTVRAGEHAVALDERDMDGFYVPDGAQASVFVHVHETGESYVIFRVCPEYPQLDIMKEASIVPAVKVTKSARLNNEKEIDGAGALIDYEIDIKSNGLTEPTTVRVVDSFPDNTKLILAEEQELTPVQSGNEMVYEISAARERIQKSAYYSLKDLSPGTRKFVTNRIHIEGASDGAEDMKLVVSEPLEVAVGPFLLAPPQDVQITLTPALFITSKADLQAPAIPELNIVADSIDRYPDADIKVEGHTDYRRIHTKQFPSNWELGEARAKSVVDWLVDNRGIDRDRLAYESFAATKPVVHTGTTSEELQPNRRTEVIIHTSVDGFLAPGVAPDKEWENSTVLELDPVDFDTLFEKTEMPMEIGLDDTWEVVLSIENSSAIAADDAILSDILPDGVEYIEGSALIDGKPIDARVSGTTLTIMLERVEASQKMQLRYRIRAIQGATPTGGGAASVEVKTATDLPVIRKSNTVRFR